MEITARTVVLVMIGGAIGAPARFVVSVALTRAFHGPSFPVATFVVNVIGSFLLAALTWVAGERYDVSPSLRVLLGTGMLGAFTTYSTFSVETLLLLERDRTGLALLYVVVTVVAVISAAFLGMRLVQQL